MSKNTNSRYSLVEVKKNKEGFGGFAIKSIKRGEAVITSKPVRELKTRTSHSAQVDWNKHILTDKPARYINHSCDPTVGVRSNKYGAYDFIALKDLPIGTEVTACYSTVEYEITGFSKCSCGSPKCLKKVTGWKDFPDLRKRFFIKKGFVAPYLLTKK